MGASGPKEGPRMEYFYSIFMPSIIHWQHPRFLTYFLRNASPPAIHANFLTSTMAVQCKLWQTSPAATEIETRMIEWL